MLAHSPVPGNEFADSVAKAARSRWFPFLLTCESIGDTELVEKMKNAIISIESALLWTRVDECEEKRRGGTSCTTRPRSGRTSPPPQLELFELSFAIGAYECDIAVIWRWRQAGF